MVGLTSPLQIATLGDAFLWPLAAGAGMVVWSRARRAARAHRLAKLDTALLRLHRSLEVQPVPERLTLVVEALEEGEELAGAAKRPAETTR